MRIKHDPIQSAVQSMDNAIRNLSGLPANKVTEEMVDKEIEKAECLVFPETTVTICCITLKNGWHVIGSSDCVDPEEYNETAGQSYAIQDARDKIWQFLGFRLKDTLALKAQQKEPQPQPGEDHDRENSEHRDTEAHPSADSG